MIRALTSADREDLASFTCARLGESWAESVQETIRLDLADQLASAHVSAIGLFDQHGKLCGVAAWRLHTSITPRLCRGDIVAVAIGERGQGCGRALKEAMLADAKAAGAVAVSSVVHRDNVAMIHLNRTLGGVVDEIADGPDHCLCVVSLRDRD